MPQKEIQADVEENGITVKYDGGDRFITEAEIAEMCRDDAPVTVR